MTAKYTTDELKALAADRGPFAVDNMRAAILLAADTLDAARVAVDAECARAESAVAKERAKCALIARLWGETHEPWQTVNARNAASKIARGIEGQDGERL